MEGMAEARARRGRPGGSEQLQAQEEAEGQVRPAGTPGWGSGPQPAAGRGVGLPGSPDWAAGRARCRVGGRAQGGWAGARRSWGRASRPFAIPAPGHFLPQGWGPAGPGGGRRGQATRGAWRPRGKLGREALCQWRSLGSSQQARTWGQGQRAWAGGDPCSNIAITSACDPQGITGSWWSPAGNSGPARSISPAAVDQRILPRPPPPPALGAQGPQPPRSSCPSKGGLPRAIGSPWGPQAWVYWWCGHRLAMRPGPVTGLQPQCPHLLSRVGTPVSQAAVRVLSSPRTAGTSLGTCLPPQPPIPSRLGSLGAQRRPPTRPLHRLFQLPPRGS